MATKPATASSSKTATPQKRPSRVPAPEGAVSRAKSAIRPTAAKGEATDGASAELKKRELIDLVVEKSEVRKKFAKPVIETLLEVLGQTLAEGRELNLQPLGKVKLNRSKETPNARIIVAKIRQNKRRPVNKVKPEGVAGE